MKTDLYTKTMLTVIAAALVWLCIQPAVFPQGTVSAQAQEIQKVRLVDQNGAPLLVSAADNSGRVALPVKNLQ